MAYISLGAVLKNLVTHGQSFLVYPAAFIKPRRHRTPTHYGLAYEDVEITTSDNVRLRCFLIESSKSPTCPHPARATVIMFHGNGMDHTDLLSQAKWYHRRLSCNVLTVSYRGYANSGGVPSERGLQRDAQAVLDFVWNHDRLSKLPVIVYGLSLGGAVAIDVTSKNPQKVTALILENTFTSIPDIVHSWPLIGRFSFLCTQRWNSASKLPKIPSTLPILFCSGRNDQVVPPSHMNKLYEIAEVRGKPPPASSKKGGGILGGCGVLFSKKGSEDDEAVPAEEWVAPSTDSFADYMLGGHVNTFVQPRYWDNVQVFIDRTLSGSRVIIRGGDDQLER